MTTDWRKEPQVLDVFGTLALIMLDEEIGERARQIVSERSQTGITYEMQSQVRIHYSYGVNSGTEVGTDGLGSILRLREDVERRTQGPIDVTKVEYRTRIEGSTRWKDTYR